MHPLLGNIGVILLRPYRGPSSVHGTLHTCGFCYDVLQPSSELMILSLSDLVTRCLGKRATSALLTSFRSVLCLSYCTDFVSDFVSRSHTSLPILVVGNRSQNASGISIFFKRFVAAGYSDNTGPQRSPPLGAHFSHWNTDVVPALTDLH